MKYTFDQHKYHEKTKVVLKDHNDEVTITSCTDLTIVIGNNVTVNNLYILGDVGKLTILNCGHYKCVIDNMVLFNTETKIGLNTIKVNNLVDYNQANGFVSNMKMQTESEYPKWLKSYLEKIVIKLI